MTVEGCHSSILGPQPRGRTTESWMQDGYIMELYADGTATRVPRMVKVRTDWLAIPCGIKRQPGFTDEGCRGCTNYPENNNES